jgi:hypothetical protein
MKRPLLALSFSLWLVACQSTPQVSPPPQNTTIEIQTPNKIQPKALIATLSAAPKPIEKPGIDVAKPQPQAQLSIKGNQIQLKMSLPPLDSFRTQALDFTDAAKITATLTDSNGNVYQPAGADGGGQVVYPVSGNLSLTFNNIYPDRLLIAELKIFDTAPALIPQTDLALAFSHNSGVDANVVMNFSTTPAGQAMKALFIANATRARAINLTDLNTLSDTITGKTGTYPTLSYTTHPSLVKVAQLATDLATQDPTALTAANYRNSGATVNATVSGLVATDLAELQVTDASSAIKTNAGNGLQIILKATPGSGLKLLAKSTGSPGTNYTYVVATNPLTLTDGGTQAVTVTATPATPTLTGLSASNGTIGSSLTITGTNFHTALAGNVVKFGTTTATVTAATATSLTVTVPAGISGTQNVTVAVGSQTNTGTNNFEVKPVITSFSPTGTYEGTSFTIAGTGFDTTPANNTVMIGSTAATVTAATATSLTVTVPVMTIGSYATTVKVGNQTSASSSFNVTPGVISLGSSNGIIGSSLTLTGKGFDTTPANNTVKFGTTTATVTAASATSLTVTVPAAISGTQNVSVTVAGLSNPGTNNFAVTPAITSLDNSSGGIGSSLTITGTGFDGTTMANNTVKFGTTTATVTAATATSITVTVPPGITGTQNVTVAVGAQTNTGTNNYAVTPAITSLSAANGVLNDSITLTGTGFDSTPANNTVKFGLTSATVTAATSTQLTVKVPNAVAGTQNITVQVGTQTSNASSFTIMPKITAVNTAETILGKPALIHGAVITLTGSGFDLSNASNNNVFFGATNITASAVIGSDLQVVVPRTLASGDLNVSVSVNSQSSNAVVSNVPVVSVSTNGGFY